MTLCQRLSAHERRRPYPGVIRFESSYFRRSPTHSSSTIIDFKHDLLDCITDAAPNCKWINQILEHPGIKHVLTRDNYWSCVLFNDSTYARKRGEQILLVWREVLLGTSTVAQVWRQQNAHRGVMPVLKNKRKIKENMMRLINSLHDEICVDRAHLCLLAY